MVRFHKRGLLILVLSIILLVLVIKLFKVSKSLDRHPLIMPDKALHQVNLYGLVIIIREFEEFEHDVMETTLSSLKACNRECRVVIISDEIVYPPFHIHDVDHIILTADIFRHSADLSSLFVNSKYVMFLPDGSRFSSYMQILDLIRLLNSGDTEAVAVSVGLGKLACQRYSMDVPSWSLTVLPAHDSEACDGVSGRAAILTRSSHIRQLTYPVQRPVALSYGIQSTVRKGKIHISRQTVLGEGRQLFETEHLKWKLETLEEERKKDLFKKLGVKKVVGANRRVEWYGCTRTTQRCFPTIVNDTPSYLYQGRWTPPCCLEGLRVTARHVFNSLKECRMRWWLEGGSLLGAVRNGDIISWDYDVDVGVYAGDVDKCPHLRQSRWQTVEDSDGYVWQKAPEGDFYRVHYSIANHLHVDIFPFKAVGGMMVRNNAWNSGHKQDVDFPEHFLRPMSSINFVGYMASAPNNVRDFLEYKFGPGVIENPQYPNSDLFNSRNITLPRLN